ncbi:MAG: CHASE domain-containing protein [Deltaproteobacteria bacterium]|nr:CHASE domain-containing protein [Deltaproteobacteria bacterium]
MRPLRWMSSPLWPPLLFAVVAVPSLVSWRLARGAAEAHRRDATQLVAEELGRRLAEAISVRTTLVDGIRRELEAGQLRNPEAFRVRALEIIRSFPGYQAINRLDPSGVIRQVVPEDTNQAAMGKNVRAADVPERAIRAAQESGGLALSEPVPLYQGGLGFVGYVPVRGHGGAPGEFLNVAFRIADLVDLAWSPRIRASYAMRLSFGQTTLYEGVGPAGEKPVSWPARGDRAAQVMVPVGSMEWELALVPLHGVPWTEQLWQDAAFATALMLALLLSVLVWVGQRRALRLAALEVRVREQQRLESLGTLAAGVAHEINNPLTGIMGYAEMLSEDAPPGGTERERAGRILREALRVKEIVRGLLTFSRRESPVMEPADPAALVQSTLVLMRTVLRKDAIDLRVETPDGLPQVRCHPQGLQQVLMNLLTNARDAVAARPEGSRVVTLSLRRLDAARPPRVRFTVEDNGVGIPAESLDRIFEPFYTTKSRERGTGLGLSVSFGIVRDHGGDLLVESEPGRGTRFHIDIPIWQGDADQPATA